MRVFLTGATGFIGSHLVREFIDAGHAVVGLARSDAGAAQLAHAGAEVRRGDVNDAACLRDGTRSVDAVVHAAFHHDFANLRQHSENDRRVIATLGALLAGSDRPFLVTSGTGLVRPAPGQPARESDAPMSSAEFPRAATEEAADALIAEGGRVMIVRLPQVHDRRHHGRITQHIQLARQQGWVAYVGDGLNRVPAAHVSDVARLYRLALENGAAGQRYHAVSEEGVPLREIAEVVGARLKLPVESIAARNTDDYFGSLSKLVTMDLAASGDLTRRALGWHPTGSDLLSDLREMDDGA